MKPFLIGGLICVIGFSNTAYSNPAAPFLERLYDAAMAHPSVKLANLNREKSNLDFEAAQWSKYPSVSVDGARSLESDGAVTFRVEQPLWTAGRTDALINVARTEIDVAQAEIEEARQAIKLEVGLAYADMFRSQLKLSIADSNIEELSRLSQVIARRVAQEVSAEAEQLLVDARLEQAKAERQMLNGQFMAAQTRLYEATNMDVLGVSPLECGAELELTESVLVEQALNQSPTLDRLGESMRVAQSEVNVARSERFPKLVLGLERLSDASLTAEVDESVYLGFQYQLSDGFSINSRIASAEKSIQTASFDRKVASDALKREVRLSFQEHKASQAQLVPLMALVDANQGLIASYLRQYRVGKKSWLDVVNAQREVAQSQQTLADIKGTLCSSVIKLGLLSNNLFVSELEEKS